MKIWNQPFQFLMLFILCFSCNSNKKSSEFLGNWVEVMPPNLNYVQGFTLDKENKASSIGMATLLYNKWEVKDNKLILWGQSIGNGQTIDFSDTLLITKITQDSLILESKYKNETKYYKVKNLDPKEKY